jgi:hypothetical protein
MARLAATLRHQNAFWSGRERDLITAIQEQHARLSAGLLQGSLFDRRSERAARFQTALLNDVIASSHARLSELASWHTVSARRPELIFAVAID